MTPRQGQLLEFIRKYQDEHGGASPSFAEMAVAMNIQSKSGVHGMLTLLQHEGRIRRRVGNHRSIEIIEKDPISIIRSQVALLVERHGMAFAADLLRDVARSLLGEAA